MREGKAARPWVSRISRESGDNHLTRKVSQWKEAEEQGREERRADIHE